LTFVPFLEGERTPNLPAAKGAWHGVTSRNMTAANIARAAVEGLLFSLEYCLDKLAEQGVEIQRLMLVGGGARSAAVRRIAPNVFGVDVAVPTPGEYVAVGAARQAAWTLGQQDSPPPWQASATVVYPVDATIDTAKEQYRTAQWLTLGQ
jgi:xylulokinase